MSIYFPGKHYTRFTLSYQRHDSTSMPATDPIEDCRAQRPKCVAQDVLHLLAFFHLLNLKTQYPTATIIKDTPMLIVNTTKLLSFVSYETHMTGS